MEIKGFIETSFIDWDSKLSSVIFLPNCNFRCPFCHNHQLILEPEEMPSISREKIAKFWKTHNNWIDGVTITGGEPLLHTEKKLIKLLEWIHSFDLPIKMDTNGAFPDKLMKLLDNDLIQMVAMDVKNPLDENYQLSSGVKVDIEKLKRTIDLIISYEKNWKNRKNEKEFDYEFRITVVPTLHTIKEIENIARTIKGAKKLALQNFVSENAYSKELQSVKPYSLEDGERFKGIASKYVEKVILRGKWE